MRQKNSSRRVFALNASQQASRSGFTLVELLLFAGIIAIMAGALVGFSIVSMNIAIRNEVMSEVEQNGDIVLQRVLQAVQTSDAIAYPAEGDSSDILVLVRDEPYTEIFFYQNGDRIAYVENGVVSYLTTGDAVFQYLSFLHFGTAGASEGASVVLQAGNAAVGTEAASGQYQKIFRGTSVLTAGSCRTNDDCTGDCCDGRCVPVGSACPVVSPACNTLTDCATVAPFCSDLTTCAFSIPRCIQATHTCGAYAIQPCPQCSGCGDGVLDYTRDEECDDGDTDNSDSCTNDCTMARCGDGVLWSTDGGTEECDDGNTVSDDGCSVVCVNENLCVGGAPDGVQDGGEECDDGDG